jgi:ribose transport system substrate-binding protein
MEPVLAAALLFILVGGRAVQGASLQIAVIPKGSTHSFWKTIHAGAAKAAKEFGVEIIWVAPEKEDDRKQQIDVVQNFISRGVNAIVLAPLDDVALAGPVEAAKKKGIPTVIIDSDLKSDSYISFVATDNKQGGRLGADRLGKIMGGKGTALMLRYAEGSASTRDREAGFLEEMAKKYPGVQLVSTNQYGGVTKESAFQASQNLLNKFPDVEGVFCPNEPTAFGMLRALQTSGKAGKVKFVGFDTSDDLLSGLKKGHIQGLVAQDPFGMAYLGVKTAVDHLKGKKVKKRVATGLIMVTSANVNDPKVWQVIHPDIEKWLK